MRVGSFATWPSSRSSSSAEDYREDRRERATERESIETLIRDLGDSDFASDSLRATESAFAIRRILAARDSTPPSPDTLSAWLSRATLCTAPVFNNSEYVSLRSSGAISNIRDDQFRAALVAHYERYELLLMLSEADCNWDYMRPIAQQVAAAPGLLPRYAVSGTVEEILANRAFALELAHAHSLKNLVRIRFSILERSRAELLAQAKRLVETW